MVDLSSSQTVNVYQRVCSHMFPSSVWKLLAPSRSKKKARGHQVMDEYDSCRPAFMKLDIKRKSYGPAMILGEARLTKGAQLAMWVWIKTYHIITIIYYHTINPYFFFGWTSIIPSYFAVQQPVSFGSHAVQVFMRHFFTVFSRGVGGPGKLADAYWAVAAKPLFYGLV